jgi:hypothetical protein
MMKVNMTVTLLVLFNNEIEEKGKKRVRNGEPVVRNHDSVYITVSKIV